MGYPSLRVIPTVASVSDVARMMRSRGSPTNVDRFGRRIDYLRISLTDRCNLRCVYCMPEGGADLTARDALLRHDEIVRIAAAAFRLGFHKFRFTGGEPLVVRDVLPLLRALRDVTHGATRALTTNGVRLAEMAHDLRAAGISRVNISLDTLNAERFIALTRRDALAQVLEGIDAALEAGFERIKVNAVIVRGVNEDELLALAELARKRPLHVRFIEQMPLDAQDDAGFLSADVIGQKLQAAFALESVAPEAVADAAQNCWASPSWQGTLAVIAPRSRKFCSQCNRLRLTPHGEIKGCLLSEGSLDLRAPLRAGISDAQLLDLLRYAIDLKPLEYNDSRYGLDRPMSAIGG